RLLGREADLDHAFVDGRAGTRGTFVVHGTRGRLLARGLALFEHDDLGVLTAELDHRPRVRVELLDRERDRVHLLDELRAEGQRERPAPRAGDEDPNLFARDLSERLAYPHEEIEHALRLLGVVPLVVAPEDLL